MTATEPRPAGYPYGEWDAMKWAEEFVRIVRENPEIATDEGTMVGWFANAIMTGADRCGTSLREALEAIRLTQEYVQLPCEPGWSWWDVYSEQRPVDAARLREEWLRTEANTTTDQPQPDAGRQA